MAVLVRRIGAQGLFRPAEEGTVMMTTRRPNRTFINSPGRTRGARNRLTVRVFEDVLAHWNEPASPGASMTKGHGGARKRAHVIHMWVANVFGVTHAGLLLEPAERAVPALGPPFRVAAIRHTP
jgi:hypothetical protein